MTAASFAEGHAAHADPGHPERPARLDAIRQRVAADPALAALVPVDAPSASRAALERVHAPDYLDLLETFCDTGGGRLDPDTYATRASYAVARRACGGLVAVADVVLSGDCNNGFAVGRPPGHHARPMQAMGFCLLSHVAVAARHAQAVHGAERVLIVDVDVHHGNGTQEAFYDDPSVLFVSTHQAGLFPGGGRLDETGVGAGQGATVNVPLPAGTDDALVSLYRAVLPPLAARFRPDVVFVSAGFDAHRLDPLGGLACSVAGLVDAIGVCAEVADRWAGGRLVLSLEGGYHADALAACVTGTLRRLLDSTAPVEDPFGPSRIAGPDLGPLTERVRQRHGVGV